jgi:hypothetical protein
MIYRQLGKTGLEVSQLGFGCMRFPLKSKNTDDINEDLAIKMLRYAIDQGVNYIDTAYPYHGYGFGSKEGGASEPLVAKALKNGYREKVVLATKLPSWIIESRADMDYYLDYQLKRLQTDHIDCYLVHAVNKTFWEKLQKNGVLQFLDQAKKDGRIKYAGFSFHDDCKTFKKVIDAYDWDLCQIQYNYLDRDFQAGDEGLQYAYDRDIGVVIMEPLRGGALINNLPTPVKQEFAKSEFSRKPADWAFRWLYNDPRISVVLSGMSDMQQVKENIKTASLAKRLGEVSKRLKEVAGNSADSEEEPEVAADDEEADDDDENEIIFGTVRVNTSLNVRTSPWGTITGSLHNNDRVKIIGKEGDWYKIDRNGQTAYVHANYVDTPQQSAGQTPVNRPSSQPSSDDAPSPAAIAANGGPLTSAPCQPMPGRASSEFGWRTHPTLGTRRFHNGIDLPVANGTRLNALGDGTVVDVGYESGGGRYVKVRYANGYESFYCHLQSVSVSEGDPVRAGQEVARSDNTGQWTTGPHLHFGLKRNGSYINPRSAGIPLP